VHGATYEQVLSIDANTAPLYSFSMPANVRTPCPVPGCYYQALSRTSMRRHFAWRHLHDSLCIQEEGRLPRCPRCGIFLHFISQKHLNSIDCRRLADRNRRQQTYEQAVATTLNTTFYIDGTPIENVTDKRYLGCQIQHQCREDLAIAVNLKKARQKWGYICRLVSRDIRNPKCMARFYTAIVVQTLLFGSASWVLTDRQKHRLESFHNRCARRMAHQPIHRQSDGTWVMPHTDDVLERCSLSRLSELIVKRKTHLLNTYAYEHSPLYRQCLESTPAPTAGHHGLVWWDDPLCRSLGALGVPPRSEPPRKRRRVNRPSLSDST